MWSVLRSRTLSSSSKPLGFLPAVFNRSRCLSVSSGELLKLEEVEKILSDVKADNVRVIPIPKHCEFADFMVVATGRSAWHVRNIAQALIYNVKQKQRGEKRMLLPSVEGQEGGKWIVIDSGRLIIHAFDEKVRSYYDLDNLWTSNSSNNGRVKVQVQDQDQTSLDKALVKIRPKNNSKKRPKPVASTV